MASDVSPVSGQRYPFHTLSIVVPVYNSAESLPLLIEEIEAALAHRGLDLDVVLVNDGSQDRSWDTICGLAEGDPRIRGIDMMRNFGQHNALLCGIRAARGEVIVTMDDDLQHPPSQIPKLLDRMGDDVDVVYGTPMQEQHGLVRDVASQVTKLTLKGTMGVEIARQVGPFRAFRTLVREAFDGYRGTFVSIDVLLTWGTSRFAAVAVEHHPRRMGASQYTFRKLLTHAINMMTGFSVLPLQLASLTGFGFTLFGLLVLAWVIGRFLIQGGKVPGFPFLASTIAIFSGAQLFALGIMGEYLARIHFRTMERPPYVVRRCAPQRS